MAAASVIQFSTTGSSPQRLPNVVQSGSTLLVLIQLYSQISGTDIPLAPSIADDLGANTYNLISSSVVTRAGATYGMWQGYFIATDCKGVSTNIALTPASSVYTRMNIWEISPSVLDTGKVTTNTGTTSGSISAGSLTPSVDGAILFGGWTVNNGGGGDDFVANSGWTLDLHNTGGNGETAATHYNQTTAASVAIAITAASAQQWTASGIALIPVQTPQIVQSISAPSQLQPFSSGAATGTFSSRCQAGNTIVILVGGGTVQSGETFTITSVLDTDGNTYSVEAYDHLVPSNDAGVYDMGVVIAVATNIVATNPGQTNIVHVNFSGTHNYASGIAYELTPCTPGASAHTTGSSSSGAPPCAAGPITPAAAGAFVAGITQLNQNGFSAPSFTTTWIQDMNTGMGGFNMEAARTTQTVAGPLTYSVAPTGSGGTWATAVLALLPPSTGGAVAVTASATAVGVATAAVTAQAKMTPAATAVGHATATVTAISGQSITPVAIAVAAAAAPLTAPTKLTPTAIGVGVATAVVRAPAVITTTATAVGVTTATLTAPGRLTPQAIGVGQATLALTVPGVVFLTPAATAIGLASATVTAPTLTPQPLTATAQAQAAAVCLVTSGAIPVTPVASAVGSASTTLTAQANLTMSAAALSAAAMSVTSGGASIAGSATGIAQVTVVMRVGMQLTLAAQGLGTASAIFRVPQGLQANATALGTVSCILGFPGSLRPAARAISSAAATVTAPPYTKVHLLAGTSMALTLTLGDTTAYDLQISASAARDETVNTV